MNHSKEYACGLLKLYNLNTCVTETSSNNMREMIRISKEFGPEDVDWERSKEIAKAYGMRMKECYKNSMILHALRMGTYYEGWCTAIIPISHAWIVTEEGKVIEPTLVATRTNPENLNYFGTAIPIQIAVKANQDVLPAWFTYVESLRKGKER